MDIKYTGEKTLAAIIAEVSARFARTIPDYVATEAERLAAVVQNRQNANTISFIACADMHHSLALSGQTEQMTESLKHAGQAMGLIRKMVHVDFAAMLGDMIWDDGETPDAAMDAMRAVNTAIADGFAAIPNFRTRGNHDGLGQGTGTLTDAQVCANIAKWNTNMAHGSMLHGYGFQDFEEYKLRVILLNTGETSSGYRMSAEQRTWFSAALDLGEKLLADGWGSIILSHIPLDLWGSDSEEMQILAAASGVICQFHGHLHNFMVGNLGSTSIKRICIPNMCFYDSNVFDQSDEYPVDDAGYVETTTYNKTAGTEQDTAFCVVTIDRETGKVYADHYGAGYDREVDVPAW